MNPNYEKNINDWKSGLNLSYNLYYESSKSSVVQGFQALQINKIFFKSRLILADFFHLLPYSTVGSNQYHCINHVNAFILRQVGGIYIKPVEQRTVE